jgi:hypothetical protein
MMNKLDTAEIPFTGSPRSEDSVVEIAILLESRLMKRLEAAARAQGMSAGSLVRCLLRDFLCYSDSDASMRASPKDSTKTTLC